MSTDAISGVPTTRGRVLYSKRVTIAYAYGRAMADTIQANVRATVDPYQKRRLVDVELLQVGRRQ